MKFSDNQFEHRPTTNYEAIKISNTNPDEVNLITNQIESLECLGKIFQI